MPKFEVSLLQQICKQAGMISPDERVYKVISVIMEQKMSEIIKEVMAMNSQSILAKEPSSDHAKIQQLKQENQQFTEQELRYFVKQQKQDVANEKRVLAFEDLRNALIEQGIQIRRPPFLEDKVAGKFTVESVPLLPKKEDKSDEPQLDPKECLLIEGMTR